MIEIIKKNLKIRQKNGNLTFQMVMTSNFLEIMEKMKNQEINKEKNNKNKHNNLN